MASLCISYRSGHAKKKHQSSDGGHPTNGVGGGWPYKFGSFRDGGGIGVVSIPRSTLLCMSKPVKKKQKPYNNKMTGAGNFN